MHTFSNPDRDPRGRVISTCFASILTGSDPIELTAGSDTRGGTWFNLTQLPHMAFDHHLIIQTVAEKFLTH